MMYALLIFSAIVNLALAYEFYRLSKKFRIMAWREQIVRESLQKRYNEGIDSPQAAKMMAAMKRGLL